MAKTITITNTNVKGTFDVKNWNTGLNAVKGDPAVVSVDFPAMSADNGAVKFRIWETNQYVTLEAKANKGADAKTFVVTGVDSAAEEAYYLAMNGVAGLTVESAGA